MFSFQNQRKHRAQRNSLPGPKVLSELSRNGPVAEMVLTFLFPEIAPTCCFARRKLNRTQNYFESTVHSYYGDEFAARAAQMEILSKWCGNFCSNCFQRKMWSTSKGRSFLSENFRQILSYQLHFNRLNWKFRLNGNSQGEISRIQTKGPVIRATFSCNLSRNNVAVASWDCLLRVLSTSVVQQIFMLQKAKVMSLLLFATWKFVAREVGNTRNKQSQLATATLLRDRLQENAARITGP